MRAHRRSFAMIVVLLASAAIFGFAMQGGLAMRLATIETTALRDQDALLREARSAAAIVLAGLTSGPGVDETTRTDGFGTPTTSDEEDVAPLEEPNIPQLPEEIRELLFGDLPEPDDDDDANGGFLSSPEPIRRTTRSSGRYTALRKAGLPGRPIAVVRDEQVFEVSILDEGARLNVNVASAEQLTTYLKLKGIQSPTDVALASQIVDWRDEDDFVSPRGAEKDEYARRGVVIRNGDFLTIEELLYLPAMSREIYGVVQHDLTVVGDGALCVSSVSREALLSVPGMNEATGGEVLTLRDQGQLTKKSLEAALTPLSIEALEHLRLSPTSTLRLYVRPVGLDMPPFEGVAIVTDSGGIEAIMLNPPRAW